MWEKFRSCVKEKVRYWLSLEKVDGQIKEEKVGEDKRRENYRMDFCRKGKCISFIGIGGLFF